MEARRVVPEEDDGEECRLESDEGERAADRPERPREGQGDRHRDDREGERPEEQSAAADEWRARIVAHPHRIDRPRGGLEGGSGSGVRRYPTPAPGLPFRRRAPDAYPSAPPASRAPRSMRTFLL